VGNLAETPLAPLLLSLARDQFEGWLTLERPGLARRFRWKKGAPVQLASERAEDGVAALLDSRGQLIGMNTMIFSTSGSAAGIGFAVPVTSIERIVPQIIRTGRPERVGLGIEIVDARTAALRLGVTGGVVVDKVDPETPAGKAGLLPIAQATGGFSFDVIVGVDDKKIESFDDLFGALDEKAEGDKVRVQVRRLPKDEVVTLEIALVKLRQ